MKTIKTILCVTILFLTVQSSFAQKAKKASYIDKVVTYVSNEVSLSEDETAGVKDIMTKLATEKKAIKALTGEDKKAKMKELNQNRNKSFNKGRRKKKLGRSLGSRILGSTFDRYI